MEAPQLQETLISPVENYGLLFIRKQISDGYGLPYIGELDKSLLSF